MTRKLLSFHRHMEENLRPSVGSPLASAGLFDNWMTKSTLAKHLAVSVGLIDKLMVDGLPCIKIGRAVRFRLCDVEAWLRRRSTQ